MILSIWDWIRARTKAAFLAGIEDGVAELEVVEVEVEGPVKLRLRLAAPAEDRAPAIPAPPAEHEANGTTTRKAAKGRA